MTVFSHHFSFMSKEFTEIQFKLYSDALASVFIRFLIVQKVRF